MATEVNQQMAMLPKPALCNGIDDFLVDYVPQQTTINEFLSCLDDPFLVLNGEH